MQADREISRVQKKIRPVFADLRKNMSGVQMDLADVLERNVGEIHKQYEKAGSAQNRRKLKKEYILAVQAVIASKNYRSVEKDIVVILKKADTSALDIIEGEKYGIYTENYNRIGRGLKKDLNGYNFQRISEEDARYADLTDRKLDGRKLDKWNRSNIRSSIKSGSIGVLAAKALALYTVGNVIKSNLRMMDGQAEGTAMDARTLGELDSMCRADDEGYEVLKVWMATLDNRTRESHADLDGVAIPVNDVFDNGCERPRDPNGAPEEICNCRCDLGVDTGGRKNRTRAAREGKVTGSYKKPESFKGTHTVTVDNMSYREWQRWRK